MLLSGLYFQTRMNIRRADNLERASLKHQISDYILDCLCMGIQSGHEDRLEPPWIRVDSPSLGRRVRQCHIECLLRVM